jgi:hypothetical protein
MFWVFQTATEYRMACFRKVLSSAAPTAACSHTPSSCASRCFILMRSSTVVSDRDRRPQRRVVLGHAHPALLGGPQTVCHHERLAVEGPEGVFEPDADTDTSMRLALRLQLAEDHHRIPHALGQQRIHLRRERVQAAPPERALLPGDVAHLDASSHQCLNHQAVLVPEHLFRCFRDFYTRC